MKRFFGILVLILLAGWGAWSVSYYTGLRKVQPLVQSDQAQMEWLRQEYHLSDAQFVAIKKLHEDYEPVCVRLCEKVVDSQGKLARLIEANRTVTPDLEAALRECAQVKEECQQAMLGHVYRVSAAMSEEDGRRYVAMMETRVVRPGTGIFRNAPEH
jgi:hypothetical protein